MESQKGGDFRTPTWLETRPDCVVLALHLQPGARRTAVAGEHGGRLKVAVAAPPAEGRANDALLDYLAKRLGVGRRAVELLSGATSRDKRVAVRGLDAPAVAAALQP